MTAASTESQGRNRNFIVGNSILWATAIMLTAVVDGPPVLAIVLLPTLAFLSLFVGCRTRVLTRPKC